MGDKRLEISYASPWKARRAGDPNLMHLEAVTNKFLWKKASL